MAVISRKLRFVLHRASKGSSAALIRSLLVRLLISMMPLGFLRGALLFLVSLQRGSLLLAFVWGTTRIVCGGIGGIGFWRCGGGGTLIVSCGRILGFWLLLEGISRADCIDIAGGFGFDFLNAQKTDI